jgi:hypothetical protein
MVEAEAVTGTSIPAVLSCGFEMGVRTKGYERRGSCCLAVNLKDGRGEPTDEAVRIDGDRGTPENETEIEGTNEDGASADEATVG